MTRKPFILYHWSPTSNRRKIQRQGIRPNKPSRDNEWAPPYVCYSDSPSLAWGYSAAFDKTPQQWDLWMVWSNEFTDLKKRADMKDQHPTEWRTRQPAPKPWRVGTRGTKAWEKQNKP